MTDKIEMLLLAAALFVGGWLAGSKWYDTRHTHRILDEAHFEFIKPDGSRVEISCDIPGDGYQPVYDDCVEVADAE